VPWLLSLTLPLLALSPVIAPDLSIGYQGETGVNSRWLLTAGLNVSISPLLAVDALSCLILMPYANWNGYSLSAGFTYPAVPALTLQGGLQQNCWHDWYAGEDRLFLLLNSRITNRFTVGLGFCHRQPFSLIGNRRQNLFPEWNLIYQLSWKFLQKDRLELNAKLGNFDRLEIKNPQQFPFGIGGGYRLAPEWKIWGNCQTAINGLSTGLISLTNLDIEIGLQYAK